MPFGDFNFDFDRYMPRNRGGWGPGPTPVGGDPFRGMIGPPVGGRRPRPRTGPMKLPKPLSFGPVGPPQPLESKSGTGGGGFVGPPTPAGGPPGGMIGPPVPVEDQSRGGGIGPGMIGPPVGEGRGLWEGPPGLGASLMPLFDMAGRGFMHNLATTTASPEYTQAVQDYIRALYSRAGQAGLQLPPGTFQDFLQRTIQGTPANWLPQIRSHFTGTPWAGMF